MPFLPHRLSQAFLKLLNVSDPSSLDRGPLLHIFVRLQLPSTLKRSTLFVLAPAEIKLPAATDCTMEKKLQYSIFPQPPHSPTSPPPTRGRASSDRGRIPPPRACLPPGHDLVGPPPSNPPQTPLPPPPTQHAPLFPRPPSRSQQFAPPIHNSFAPPRHPPSASETHSSSAKHPSPAPQTMHTHSPASSTSSSASLTKPPIISTSSPPSSPEPAARTRPRTVYFHGGIGGAGNYRKVVRENAHAPLAHAPNAQSPRSSGQGRFLSSLFGSGKRRREAPRGGDLGSKGGSRENSREALPLGAAEAMRRKMLGPRRSSERS